MTARRVRLGATVMLLFTIAGAIGTGLLGGDDGFPLVFVAFAFVGWLVTRSHPSNSVAWVLLAFGLVGGLNGALLVWTAAASKWGLPASAVASWSQSWLWAPMLGLAFGPLLVLFPDGKLPSRRWRLVLWLSGTFVVLGVFGNALAPLPSETGRTNPYALEGIDSILMWARNIAGIALMLSVFGGVAALAVRYHRAGPVQRQQLKWFLAAAALLPVAIVLGEVRNQALQPIVMPLGLSLLAVATGIAILRHGLYDIDLIISRTVSWGLVTVVIGGVYLALVTVLTSLTAKVAGDSAFAVAGSTLAAAAAFGPVRRRIQSGVDRRFYRARYDAEQTVSIYRARLRDEVNIASVEAELLHTVDATIHPKAAVLWIPSSDRTAVPS